MKLMRRNKEVFYYCLYKGSEPNIDEYGNETGESIPQYEEPVLKRASISEASGETTNEMFGVNVDYDKVIITEDCTCPIDELSVLYVDKEPDGNPDYVVKRVSPSFNFISYAIKRV